MQAETKKKYEITNEMKFKFIALVLINEIINFQRYFPINLEGDDSFLSEYLEYMKDNGLLSVKNDKYIPTSKGRKYLVSFYDKYFEFLKVFDIYCAVDLEKGEFAFSSIFDMEAEEWKDFLNEERFSDVRVAVAEFKNINPIEIVFMSFLNEGRFEMSREGWQIYLTRDEIWNEISEICSTAVELEHLRENDAIQDVIKQGSQLMLEIIKKDEEIKTNEQSENNEIVEETTTEEVVEEYVEIVEPPYYDYAYFNPYMDIYYVSPVWLVPFVL